MPEPASWSVAVTAKAPAVVVKAFLAHHLALGAREIFIYFDDPVDPAFDLVRDVPRVRAVRCDAEHWQAACKARPRDHQDRQIVNAGEAKRASSAQWLAHIDIDEFLLPRESVATTLAGVPHSADAVRMDVCENVHRSVPRTWGEVFEGPFKRRFPAGSDGDVASELAERLAAAGNAPAADASLRTSAPKRP